MALFVMMNAPEVLHLVARLGSPGKGGMQSRGSRRPHFQHDRSQVSPNPSGREAISNDKFIISAML